MNDSEKIAELMKRIEHLYQQISALLTTADGQMSNAGWKATNSFAIAEGSQAIYNPSGWFPKQAYRFYQNAARGHLLAFVSVLLQGRDGATISEPLVIAGMFDYTPAQSVGSWDYWFARLHLTSPGRRDDGTAVVITAQDFPANWKKWKVPFQRMATLARPLLKIRNANDLNAQVIDPLVQVLGATASSVP